MQLAESRCEPDDAKSRLAWVYARHNHMNYCCIVVDIIRPSLQNNHHSTEQEAHKKFAVSLLLFTSHHSLSTCHPLDSPFRTARLLCTTKTRSPQNSSSLGLESERRRTSPKQHIAAIGDNTSCNTSLYKRSTGFGFDTKRGCPPTYPGRRPPFRHF